LTLLKYPAQIHKKAHQNRI